MLVTRNAHPEAPADRDRTYNDGRQRAERATGVVGQALRRGPQVCREELGAHGTEAAEIAGAEEARNGPRTRSQRTSAIA